MRALKALAAIAAIVAAWLALTYEPPRRAVAEPTHDSLCATYTHDGDIIRVYSVTDSDTGVEYLVSDHGGITPRIRD